MLFNDTLNTLYLRLYGVRHNVVNDHSDSERGNRLPPLHERLLLFNSIMCTVPQIGYTTPFVISIAEHWMEREIG